MISGMEFFFHFRSLGLNFKLFNIANSETQSKGGMFRKLSQLDRVVSDPPAPLLK
jgi:hypothetical protein